MSGGLSEIISPFEAKCAKAITRKLGSEAAAPRMLIGAGLRMRSQEMVEYVEKGPNMLSIITRLTSADVIDNYVTNFFRAMLLVR